MRLNNRSRKGFYEFLVTFLLMAMFFGVIAFFLERYKLNIIGEWLSLLFIIIPILLLVIFYLRGKQIFEYDSDGEALNFKNSNVIIFLGKSLSDEFPKYKLLSYEIVNAVILKRLFITISSKKSHSVILKYDISYLTRKEVKDLKLSLSRVIKQNKELNREEINS